jgi:hypothetical protein
MQAQRVALLTFVSGRRDIRGSLRTFNAATRENGHLARSLLRYTRYWVYDSGSGSFGPSKFVGFRGMSFDKYARAREGGWAGDRFSGHRARVAIERILGSYHRSSQLSARLVMWGQSLLGDDVFDDVNRYKWMFTSL